MTSTSYYTNRGGEIKID